MVIGILELEIRLFSSDSLKDKRRLMQSLIAHLRNDFNISVLEIGYRDSWRRALVGVAIVANEAKFAHRSFSKIVELIKKRRELSLIDSKMEVI